MDEDIKRDQRPVLSGPTVENPEGKSDSFFHKNGRDHFTFNSKTVVTYGLLSSLIGVCLGTLSFYNRFTSAVDERIENNRALNKKLDGFEKDFETLTKRIDKQDDEIESVYNFVYQKEETIKKLRGKR